MGMMNGQPITNKFNLNRIKDIHSLINEGIDPLTVTLCDSGSCVEICIDDLHEYVEYHNKPFSVVASCLSEEHPTYTRGSRSSISHYF